MLQAIKVKAETLLGMLEEVDGVPCAARDHKQSAAQQTSTVLSHRYGAFTAQEASGSYCAKVQWSHLETCFLCLIR